MWVLRGKRKERKWIEEKKLKVMKMVEGDEVNLSIELLENQVLATESAREIIPS